MPSTTSLDYLKKLEKEFKEVGLQELPLPTEKVTEINSFNRVIPKAFKQYREIKDDELERKKRIHSYWIRRIFTVGLLGFISLIIVVFYICLFLAIFGVINNPDLKNMFLPALSILVSVGVGFILGKTLEQSSKS